MSTLVVTNLSLGAGGLPNGSVLTDDIADSAITTAKIANANITAAKLDGAQSGSAPIYGARAWVTFNGEGTVAIISSGNVSSITDSGIGNYGVNFTTAMPNANYAVSGASRAAATSGASAFADINLASDVAPTTSAVRVRHVNYGNLVDGSRISVVIHS